MPNIFQSDHSGVSGKGSKFAIFSAKRRWPLQLLYYRTTVIQGTTLNNFIAGYTNTFIPVINKPVRGAYPICGQYPGIAECGAILTVTCPSNTTKARYVIIQQPVDGGGYMIIVELEVSGYWTISRTNYYSSHNIYTFHICTAIFQKIVWTMF